MKRTLSAIIVLSIISCSIYSQTTWYVDNIIGSDANTGLSPTSAKPKLSSIINALPIQNGDIINIKATGLQYIEPFILIDKILSINILGNGDVLINFSQPQSGMKIKLNVAQETVTFSSSGNYKFRFRGTAQQGIDLVVGQVLLNNVDFIIEPPFLFQSNIPGSTVTPSTTWFADFYNGNKNFDGLSAVSTSSINGPLPNIFHIYSKEIPPNIPSDYDLINIAVGEYIDAPVIVRNFIINGYENLSDFEQVYFNLINTDLHFSMTGRTVFKWNGSVPQNRFVFEGSVNTGFVFKSGCVEISDVPFEIQSPFLIKRIPTYCDVDPPNINPIPFVVYKNQVYHTIGIYYTDNNNITHHKCWFKENLNIGEMVVDPNGGTDQTDNGIIEKYCYNNNENLCNTYGGLYQWAEALQYMYNATNTNLSNTPEIVKGICPDNWHISSWDDLGDLESSEGGNANALKAIPLGSGIGIGTNTSGFTALFSGWRNSYYDFNPAVWNQIGTRTSFWSTSEYSSTKARVKWIGAELTTIGMDVPRKTNGSCVRCVHNLWSGRNGNLYTEIKESIRQDALPNNYKLSQNYPNPFNPITTINYSLPKSGVAFLKVYDILGREIKTLVSGEKSAGNHKVELDASNLSSGIYFYILRANEYTETKKMILLR